ncbi:MAG: acyl carrier protein [Bryobacteraceae bacterium]
MSSDEIDSRLRQLFAAAFPGLSADSAHLAERAALTAWDSVATVTLATMIEEEFGFALDLEDVAEWEDYGDVLATVERQKHG